MTQHSPRGLLIGLMQVTGLTVAKHREVRLAMALRANDEGYALLEIFEVVDDAVWDEGTYAAVEDLAERLEVQAVLVQGAVDSARVEEIAGRVRLVVVNP